MGQYGNLDKMISLSQASWKEAERSGLTKIRTVGARGNRLVAEDGHEFINMCSCSYLGLDRHPQVIEGVVEAIRAEGALWLAVSRARIAPRLVSEVEELLSEVFGAHAMATVSCSAASVGVLPLLASGHLTDGRKPLMIFDKHCHFSMNIMKASCADETEIVTCDHNDIDFVADMCRRHPQVAYVADGAYSMGGNAPIAALNELQARHGLFLYFDDSHSISAYGPRGRGYVRTEFGELGDRTLIVASLGKAFGAAGGMVLTGNARHRELLDYFAGPLGWSQAINAAVLGAIRASARIHLTPELDELQARLRSCMAYLDESIPTVNAGNGLPIRILNLASPSAAVEAADVLYRAGFYTSPVFFPVVAKDKSGLRAMGRSTLSLEDLARFCEVARPFA